MLPTARLNVYLSSSDTERSTAPLTAGLSPEEMEVGDGIRVSVTAGGLDAAPDDYLYFLLEVESAL